MVKFKHGQRIQHLKTGNIYRVVLTPNRCLIEAGPVPCYAYKSLSDGAVWVRPQTEMEDGRFIPI